jgi:hypothetical protein
MSRSRLEVSRVLLRGADEERLDHPRFPRRKHRDRRVRLQEISVSEGSVERPTR